jgi:hypothetical protein
LQLEVITKITSPINESCVTVAGAYINLTGGMMERNDVTYVWKLRYPDGSTSTIGSGGSLANKGVSTSTSSNNFREYLISLEITTTTIQPM